MAGGMIDNVLGSTTVASTTTPADSSTGVLGGPGSKFGL